MEAHRLWSNMHAVTPKDYRPNSNIPYHPGRYMLNSGEILLLKLIRGNAGEFNFYTLDRAARRNGWRDLNDGYLLGIFYSLIDRKYVLAKKTEDQIDPRYWITDAGARALQEATESKP